MLHIDPTDFTKNSFEGRLALTTIDNFLQVFFPDSYEYLKKVTPLSILETKFENGKDIELRFSPGTMRERPIVSLSGRVDFHNMPS